MSDYSLATTLKIFVLLTGLFYIFFSYLCILWTEREKTDIRNIFAGMTVALLFTFKILLLGGGLIAAVFLVFHFLA